MREPPDLPEETIIGALRASFGLRVAALTFLPIGNDPSSWAFRVEAAEGPSYFLKVRAGAEAMPGAAVPDYLRRHGVEQALAPLRTRAGTPWVGVGRFALALYPMLDARVGAEAGLSPRQWRELGATVRRLHAVPPAPELGRLVGRETFRPAGRERFARLEALLGAAAPADPVARELAGLWRARRQVIHALAERADALGRELRRSAHPQVLCHADLHTWNVLVDGERRLWLVDWDEAVLAPKERDLMFVIRGIVAGLVRPRDTDDFFQGYGGAAIDQRLLVYYRAAWAVCDIAVYGNTALVQPGLGEASRRDAVAGFLSLFEPGNIVDLATGEEWPARVATPPAAPRAGGEPGR